MSASRRWALLRHGGQPTGVRVWQPLMPPRLRSDCSLSTNPLADGRDWASGKWACFWLQAILRPSPTAADAGSWIINGSRFTASAHTTSRPSARQADAGVPNHRDRVLTRTPCCKVQHALGNLLSNGFLDNDDHLLTAPYIFCLVARPRAAQQKRQREQADMPDVRPSDSTDDWF